MTLFPSLIDVDKSRFICHQTSIDLLWRAIGINWLLFFDDNCFGLCKTIRTVTIIIDDKNITYIGGL